MNISFHLFLKTNLMQCYILNVYIQSRNKLPLLCLPSTSLRTLKFPSVVILECREHTQHLTLLYHIQPGQEHIQEPIWYVYIFKCSKPS